MDTGKENAQKITNVARAAADSIHPGRGNDVDEPRARLRHLYLTRVSGRTGRRLRALMTRRTSPGG